jgi:hypothetical protein
MSPEHSVRVPRLPTRQLLTALREWQANDAAPPITCSEHAAHGKMEPVIEDDVVVLRCRQCAFRRGVPRSVMKRLTPSSG